MPPQVLAHRLDDPALLANYSAAEIPAPTLPRLTADQASVAAVAFSPVLEQVRAHAVQTSAEARVAAQRANPLISFTPDKVLNAAAGSLPWTVALTLFVPLLYPGQQAARDAVRDATDTAVRYDVTAAIWQARATAVTAFRQLQVARAAEAVARALAAKDAERLAAAERLYAAHHSGRAERAIIFDAAARSAADVPVRAGASIAAAQALAAAIGLPPSAGAGLQPDWAAWDQPPAAIPLGTLADTALFNRLDVQAALSRLRAADAAVGEATAGSHPEIAVAPGYTYDRGDHRLQFGIEVAPPLFHDGSAKVAAAQAARAAALADIEALQARILDDVAQGRDSYMARRAAWAAYAPLRALAASEVDRAARELSAGSGDRPALLDAQSRQLATQLAQLDALAAVQSAAAALEAAVERPLWPTSAIALPAATIQPEGK